MTAPIAENRRARYDYHLEEQYEAGMVLQGWEIKDRHGQWGQALPGVGRQVHF